MAYSNNYGFLDLMFPCLSLYFSKVQITEIDPQKY